jgi:hypothetical protein
LRSRPAHRLAQIDWREDGQLHVFFLPDCPHGHEAPIALHDAYIGLYVVFFMLDDLIIFVLAAFAVQKIVNTCYAAISRMIGGVVLIGLGGWMLAR